MSHEIHMTRDVHMFWSRRRFRRRFNQSRQCTFLSCGICQPKRLREEVQCQMKGGGGPSEKKPVEKCCQPMPILACTCHYFIPFACKLEMDKYLFGLIKTKDGASELSWWRNWLCAVASAQPCMINLYNNCFI